MANIYTYIVDLPTDTHEMVAPCADGYTIYLRAGDTREMQLRAYRHALGHVLQGDFDKGDVQSIETEAHGGKK